MKLNINKRQGKMYWGAMPLPQGAELVGTVTRNGYDAGALLKMATGIMTQGNAGVMRSLPQEQ